ncbi:PD-(D/E)XK nuclease family protein [Hydrogenophaga sp.]|uniref:PD-(D/E)XK nuclease family protein n=1 Tax=Hydrogenophaga sp. TaxID=1904254 RepID=UPI002719DB57|nr:PD-(D/E)XK nuclease family protein [Hydrogenophaga sp.]MDO9438249.1 PD-(D/E)XK nuclease family protein [Hydrogenophaga sp.]
MTHVSPIHGPGSPGSDPAHPSARHWTHWIAQIEHAARDRSLPAGRVVVLVPYAQLMDVGRRAWALSHPSGFAPRFESTRNWATGLRPFPPGPTDLSMDMARDSLMAAALIDRVAPTRADAALRAVMVGRLVEAARQLAPLAAAVPPEQRLAWAEPLRSAMVPAAASLHWEGLLATLALTWASTSAYATDVLWTPMAQAGAHADLLVVLQGFQDDPLATALAARWGDRALVLPLREVGAPADGAQRLHACGDAEDEAQRAAACVIEHVNEGRVPVALVANDRLLTRRVSAMLHRVNVSVRDETGWKLSTTHAAAQLMSVLRAVDGRASMDDVLDLLKQATAWPEVQVQQLEQLARELGVSRWKAAVQHTRLALAIPQGLPAWIDSLQAARPLTVWLGDLAIALKACGLWTAFEADPAGQQLLQSLRLGEDAAMELAGVAQAVDASARAAGRMSLSAFTAWVRDVLEGASFKPRIRGDVAVVVLPMEQLLGRSFPATVVPGCDEAHLSPSPEPPGEWTVAQRELLGLPSRETLAEAASQAWQATLALPQLDILWRTQDRGEATLPSAWVQALQEHPAHDPREQRALQTTPQARPMPSAGDVLPESLSASAYQDLRDCPYRFFALRQLRLIEAAELEAEPDQRDMGNWLHAVLRAFHEQRLDTRPGRDADRAWLDRLADETAAAMGLNAGEGGAGFLPYQAVWPALREGYLDWLSGFEATEHGAGPRFAEAEAERSARAGEWKLYGKLDRIDLQNSPEGPIPFVIDYKTESRNKTHERVKDPLEDTQLAFYAALLPDENLRAAYLSITDKRGDSGKDTPTWLVEQPDVLMARDQLREGLAHDMSRVAAGQPMPALGEGRVCEFCAARGLCRKDFWTAE